MLPKINPLNLGIVPELTWSAGSKDRSIVDDISAISDLQGFSDVVIGDEDPDLPGFKVLNDLLDLEYSNRIDARKGFVQQNELGRNNQRSRNLHPPPLSSGQCVRQTFSDV